MSSNKIQRLCEYIDANKCKNYPIENSILEKETDFIKNGYLKMLAVLLQQCGDITDEQTNLFKRIVAGAGIDSTVEDFYRQALEIEIDDYVNFINDYENVNLVYRFILDGLLLISVGNVDEDAYKLLASFCEDFKISKDELKYLATKAKGILEFDEMVHLGCSTKIPMEVFVSYINSGITGNDFLEAVMNSDSPVISICGANINLEEKKLEFIGKKKIEFFNCNFTGKSNCIFFNSCEEIYIDNCNFKDFNGYTMYINDFENIDINNSNFLNCIYRYRRSYSDWQSIGGVIHIGCSSSLFKAFNLFRCNFENCGGKNSENYYSSEVISNYYAVNARDCKFKNCRNIPEVLDRRRTLFPKGSINTDCVFENSASFCEN